ncbi:MAG: biopolymer transporter ExbD [Desulfobacterales bacterium]
MLVHRKKRPRYQIQAPLTSLIDIVFMLLIYFLLTTNFMVDEGIKIKLPRARQPRPRPSGKSCMWTGDGRAYLMDEEVALDDMFARVKAMIAQ